MFFSPIRNYPKKKTHKQIFGTHPVPGQSRKFVYVYVFFLSLKKIILTPPPPQNSPQTPSRPLAHPPPFWERPPPPGIFNEKPTPPPSWRLGLPLPFPRSEKNIRNVHQVCNFEPQSWPEIITSRDAESACFKGSRTSCDVIHVGFFWPNFGLKKSHHVMDASS